MDVPRPGEPCVYCKGPIHMRDSWIGGKGDYWHDKCYSAESHLDRIAKELTAATASPLGREQTAADWNPVDQDLVAIRIKLDFAGVPARVDESYGPGQAGRLAWFLDHMTYIIHELGIPSDS